MTETFCQTFRLRPFPFNSSEYFFLANIQPTKYFHIPLKWTTGPGHKLMTIIHCFTNYPRLDSTTIDSIAKKKVPSNNNTGKHLGIDLEECSGVLEEFQKSNDYNLILDQVSLLIATARTKQIEEEVR